MKSFSAVIWEMITCPSDSVKSPSISIRKNGHAIFSQKRQIHPNELVYPKEPYLPLFVKWLHVHLRDGKSPSLSMRKNGHDIFAQKTAFIRRHEGIGSVETGHLAVPLRYLHDDIPDGDNTLQRHRLAHVRGSQHTSKLCPFRNESTSTWPHSKSEQILRRLQQQGDWEIQGRGERRADLRWQLPNNRKNRAMDKRCASRDIREQNYVEHMHSTPEIKQNNHRIGSTLQQVYTSELGYLSYTPFEK